MKKISYNWEEIIQLINKLAEKIKESKVEFDGLYGVPRGGLVPAVILSHKLNLPLLLFPTGKTLVIEDISDTGKTLAKYKNHKIATIFNTKWTNIKPDYFVIWKENKDSWIVFPWEDPEKET